MTDKIEETIKEIATKHGIAVGRDDPILILHTINDRLIQDSAAAQRAILDNFKSEIEEITHRWSEDAKNKAERTLNAALVISKDEMTKGMKAGSIAATQAISQTIDANIEKLLAPIRAARQVAFMNLIAAFLTVFAAAVVAWKTL